MYKKRKGTKPMKKEWNMAWVIRLIRSLFAYTMAGFLVPYLWPLVAQPFGIWAGFMAGMVVIFPIWYIVHYRKLVIQDDRAATIDMGLAIGIAVFVKTSLLSGVEAILSSFPTLLIMSIGAVASGVLVAKWESVKE